MAELTVTVATHYFKINRISARGRRATEDFARKYIQYDRAPGRGFGKIALKVFATSTADRAEYRFHINQLPAFKECLVRNYLTPEMVDTVILPTPTYRTVELKVFDHLKAYPEQIPAIDFLVSDEGPVSKLIGMGTGTGKSVVAMLSVAKMQLASAYFVKASFLEKWMIDLDKTYDLAMEDVMVVKGSKALQKLIAQALEGIVDWKILLVSTKTIQNWINQYEKFGDNTLLMDWPCRPDEFFEAVGVGIRIIDEVHMEFHSNFKIDLYTHVRKSASFSASMEPDDAFLNRMVDLAYPRNERFMGPALVKHVSATSIVYRFDKPQYIRYENHHQRTYSHHVFEESIFKQKKVLANYVKMLSTIVEGELMNDYVPGEKILIYGAGVEFCGHLVSEFRKLFPSLTMARYCGSAGDPYSNLMESDLCVTTLASAGTNVDIPNLKCVILSANVLSSQSNIQGFGRLRDKLAKGRRARFIWTVCEDIPKHLEYHKKKVELLTGKALTLNSQNYGYLL